MSEALAGENIHIAKAQCEVFLARFHSLEPQIQGIFQKGVEERLYRDHRLTTPIGRSRVFFGATVTYATSAGHESTVTIVGADEIDPDRNRISWLSPMARALMKAEIGDCVTLRAPGGLDTLEILAISYPDHG